MGKRNRLIGLGGIVVIAVAGAMVLIHLDDDDARDAADSINTHPVEVTANVTDSGVHLSMRIQDGPERLLTEPKVIVGALTAPAELWLMVEDEPAEYEGEDLHRVNVPSGWGVDVHATLAADCAADLPNEITFVMQSDREGTATEERYIADNPEVLGEAIDLWCS